MRQNIKLTIEYNGTDYAGWQFQPNTPTIQGEIETALRKLTSRKITLYAAGRTDAGVHALGQTANFFIDHKLPPQKYADALNFYLPNDILIRSAEKVPIGFHARYDAIMRRYRYVIGLEKSALQRDTRWEIDYCPDLRKLENAAAIIEGDNDFTTFCVVRSQKENNHCLVYQSRWKRQGETLVYEIAADRFLHTMIRSLIGLMMRYACGEITLKEYKKVFYSGDHTAVGKIAPAKGLYLVGVDY